MKQIVAYECELCGNTFTEKETCETCEATHFGITREMYLSWRTLHRDAAEAGKRMSYCNDRSSRLAFDEAINRLVNFEKNNEISYVGKKPTDFYY